MNENDIEIIDVNTSNNPESSSAIIYESNNMSNKPKKSKKGLIVIILLLLIIAGLCTFIYLKKDVLFNSGNNTNENNNTNNIVEAKEEELKDSNLINIITDKAKMIVLPNFIDLFYIKGDYNGNFYFDDLYKKMELSDANKLLLILEKQKGEEINVDIDKSSNNEVKELYKQDWTSAHDRDSAMRQYDLSSINNDYRYIFGTTISNYMDISSCPSYYYDSVNKVYFSYGQCGGLDPASILTYINKLSTNGNDVYVYVSVGKMSFIEETLPNAKYNIYSDYEEKNKLQEINESKYIIDESNYDKFSEYKLTFTKDGNDYYYKSIERTK